MFEKLVEQLKRLVPTPQPAFDPSTLGDPIAMKTDWSPAKGGGSSFCTYKLISINPERIEFRPSTAAKLFYTLFIVVGISLIISFLFTTLINGFSINGGTIVLLLVGAVFTMIGGLMFYLNTVCVVFDKQEGLFWKGPKPPYGVSDNEGSKNSVELLNIHALQLVSEYCTGDKSSYYSYELNLVLENGNRINVVDHGNKNKLREDTKILADFLGKPIWDAL